MRWDDSTHTKPCAKCPYRKDAPLKLWHPDHFRKLLADDADEFGGAVYACHCDGKKPATEVRPCVGWLLNQRERGTPSIQLRLALMGNQVAQQFYLGITSAGLELYDSISAMCRANGVRSPRHPRRTKR